MKKLICLLLIALMLLAVGCGNNDSVTTTPAGESKQTETTTAKETTPVETTASKETTPVETTTSKETTTTHVSSDLPQVGDNITFGNYGGEDIEWIVLAVDDGKALLVSRYALDAKPYNEEFNKEVTWETCTLRSWLNGDFYNEAFQQSEQEMIAETHVINHDNPLYGTKGGNDTTDKIFLLSLEEVLQHFGLTKNNGEKAVWIICYGDEACCQPTAYALSQGAWQYKWSSPVSEGDRKYDCNCVWGLRSPGITNKNVLYVDYNGLVSSEGSYASNLLFNVAVRPALWYNPNP